MEPLSTKCKIILVSAMACLIAGIAMAPAGPGIPFFTDSGKAVPNSQGAKLVVAGGHAGMPYHRALNCAGGESVNCHNVRNQAGL